MYVSKARVIPKTGLYLYRNVTPINRPKSNAGTTCLVAIDNIIVDNAGNKVSHPIFKPKKKKDSVLMFEFCNLQRKNLPGIVKISYVVSLTIVS